MQTSKMPTSTTPATTTPATNLRKRTSASELPASAAVTQSATSVPSLKTVRASKSPTTARPSSPAVTKQPSTMPTSTTPATKTPATDLRKRTSTSDKSKAVQLPKPTSTPSYRNDSGVYLTEEEMATQNCDGFAASLIKHSNVVDQIPQCYIKPIAANKPSQLEIDLLTDDIHASLSKIDNLIVQCRHQLEQRGAKFDENGHVKDFEAARNYIGEPDTSIFVKITAFGAEFGNTYDSNKFAKYSIGLLLAVCFTPFFDRNLRHAAMAMLRNKISNVYDHTSPAFRQKLGYPSNAVDMVIEKRNNAKNVPPVISSTSCNCNHSGTGRSNSSSKKSQRSHQSEVNIFDPAEEMGSSAKFISEKEQ